MHVTEATLRFLFHCGSERRLSPFTLKAYGADLRDFAAFIGGRTDISSVDAEGLKLYLAYLNDRGGLKTSTVRRRLATLRSFFGWATTDDRFENPFLRWRPRLKPSKRLPRALQRPELSIILEGAKARAKGAGEITFLALALMTATGVRVGEFCAITAEDVSPDAAVLRIHGKGARDRVVFVSNEALRQRLAQLRLSRSHTDGPKAPMFVGRNGRCLSPASLRGRMKRLARRVGAARKVTPHMLRHTAATLLIEEGVDIRLVQRLLGHASIATTEIYTHVADETLRKTLTRTDVIGLVVSPGAVA